MDIKTATNHDLMREYLSLQKAGFNEMFGHNARTEQNKITDELLSRGVDEIPNIFGPIKIKRWAY